MSRYSRIRVSDPAPRRGGSAELLPARGGGQRGHGGGQRGAGAGHTRFAPAGRAGLPPEGGFAARAGSQTFGTGGSRLSTARREARRRCPSRVRRILTVEAGLAEQLPASAAAPAAGRAGGEVRPGPWPLAQSGSASFGAAAPAALAPLGLSPPLAAPRGGRGRTGPARQCRPYLSPSALQPPGPPQDVIPSPWCIPRCPQA